MLPDWPRAHGGALLRVEFRRGVEDFIVDEQLGFEPAGNGEHDLLFVEKTDTNTQWLARRLARHAGIPPRDVGYCGLKDRRAVARQWFSVRRPSGSGTNWDEFSVDGVSVLRLSRHDRKLRPGSHESNRFRIVLYPEECVDNALDARLKDHLSLLSSSGVPNYFGEQRFGADGGNIDLARRVLGGQRVRREQRSLAISAARSFLFNEALAQRVADGSWDRLLPGDLANLDGSGSVFAVDKVNATLVERLARRDIHPALCLWGEDAPLSNGEPAALERKTAERHAAMAEGLERARVRAGNRPTRLFVGEFRSESSPERIVLGFSLRPGQFATVFLREAFELQTPDRAS